VNLLHDLLEKNIKELILNETKSQVATLSGSNALMWDGYIFEAESSENCPRTALLRRVGDAQKSRTVKDFISNTHGRLFEDLFKKILSLNVEFMEEEEVEVFIEDELGNKLITARPDKIIKYNGVVYPIETKTIQSSSTAYQVFKKEKPKLGALLQLAIYMYGHNLQTGFLLYCASNWFSGFAGKGNSWKLEPSFKIFTVEKKEDGYFYFDDKKSIVTVDKIIKGSYEFLKYKNSNKLPPRPTWTNVYGEPAQYDGCTYCNSKSICDEFEGYNDFSLRDFFTKNKELFDNETIT